jgi:hypothetical protein
MITADQFASFGHYVAKAAKAFDDARKDDPLEAVIPGVNQGMRLRRWAMLYPALTLSVLKDAVDGALPDEDDVYLKLWELDERDEEQEQHADQLRWAIHCARLAAEWWAEVRDAEMEQQHEWGV